MLNSILLIYLPLVYHFKLLKSNFQIYAHSAEKKKYRDPQRQIEFILNQLRVRHEDYRKMQKTIVIKKEVLYILKKKKKK